MDVNDERVEYSKDELRVALHEYQDILESIDWLNNKEELDYKTKWSMLSKNLTLRAIKMAVVYEDLKN